MPGRNTAVPEGGPSHGGRIARRPPAAGWAAAALTSVALLAGCGGGDATPDREFEPTAGVEHLRMVERRPGVRRVVESWDHRPVDGCWSLRSRHRGGPEGPGEWLSTVVVGDDGERRRVTIGDGVRGDVRGDPCGDIQGPTALQFFRAVAASGTLRVERTRSVAGRTVQVLVGPPDQVLLGLVDPSLTTAVDGVTPVPPGAMMRFEFAPADRHPVRITTPAARIRLSADDAEGKVFPARTLVFSLVEELPATRETLEVFAIPGG